MNGSILDLYLKLFSLKVKDKDQKYWACITYLAQSLINQRLPKSVDSVFQDIISNSYFSIIEDYNNCSKHWKLRTNKRNSIKTNAKYLSQYENNEVGLFSGLYGFYRDLFISIKKHKVRSKSELLHIQKYVTLFEDRIGGFILFLPNSKEHFAISYFFEPELGYYDIFSFGNRVINNLISKWEITYEECFKIAPYAPSKKYAIAFESKQNQTEICNLISAYNFEELEKKLIKYGEKAGYKSLSSESQFILLIPRIMYYLKWYEASLFMYYYFLGKGESNFQVKGQRSNLRNSYLIIDPKFFQATSRHKEWYNLIYKFKSSRITDIKGERVDKVLFNTFSDPVKKAYSESVKFIKTNPENTFEFGITNQNINNYHRVNPPPVYYLTSYFAYSQTYPIFDNWTGALANFNLLFYINASIEKLDQTNTRFNLKKLIYRYRDSYDFQDEPGEEQELGFWSILKIDKPGIIKLSDAINIKNKSFRDFQSKLKLGKEFYVNSEIKVLNHPSPTKTIDFEIE